MAKCVTFGHSSSILEKWSCLDKLVLISVDKTKPIYKVLRTDKVVVFWLNDCFWTKWSYSVGQNGRIWAK